MSLRTILFLGPSFFRGLRKLPNLLYKAPKTFQFVRSSSVPGVVPKINGVIRLLGSFGNTESLAGAIRRAVSAASTYRHPNSLLRAYSGLAGSVRLRSQITLLPNHSYTTVNKLSEPQQRSWFQNFLSSFDRIPRLPTIFDQSSLLSPRGLLGIGCNSAVWAADVPGTNGNNRELAVKVLYNYYACPSGTDTAQVSMGPNDLSENALDWVLLHRQLERECTLRPSGHPNIVPIIGQFLDRAPTSNAKVEPSDGVSATAPQESCTTDGIASFPTEQPDHSTRLPQNWPGAEAFPEGFGTHSFTYYLLMPRFDATLADLLSGSWPASETEAKLSASVSSSPSFVVLSEMSSGSSVSIRSIPTVTKHEAMDSRCMPLDVDDAVAISAQLFDAVAELEAHGVAHRDIKPNNILIRRRTTQSTLDTPPSVSSIERIPTLSWLDERESLVTNSRFHVALTDFGCATRTNAPINSSQTSYRLSDFFTRLLDPDHRSEPHVPLAHSGNVALLAPEIACALQMDSVHLTGSDYFKADLWAMATLVYPLFGVKNPFMHSNLSSVTYREFELPALPDEAPGVANWLLKQCLKRSPSLRPDAALVADVLHTWCIVRHAHRRRQKAALSSMQSSEGLGEVNELFPIEELDRLNRSNGSDRMMPSSTAKRLRSLLDVSWAADWLTGPARPPDGIRVSFYRRITLERFAHCLQIVCQAEAARLAQMADRTALSFGTI